MENFIKNFEKFTKNAKLIEGITEGSKNKEKRKEPKEKRNTQVNTNTYLRIILINILYKILISRYRVIVLELYKNLEKEKEGNKRKKCEKKEKKEEKEIQTAIESFTHDVELQGLLADFVEMRRQLKKPLTRLSLKYNLRKLSKLSQNTQEQILVVSQTLENGWRSFFETSELKNYRKKSKIQSTDFSFHIE